MTTNFKWKRTTLEIMMIVFALAFIYPILLVILNSFKTDGDILSNALHLPSRVQFHSYVTAWTDMKFPSSFMHTLYVTCGGVAGIVLISSMAGFKLSRTKTWYSTFLFYLSITPMIISFASIMIPLMKMASALNLTSRLTGLMVIYWGLFSPASIFLYHGFSKTIPKELDESAYMDGCGAFRSFFTIIFPLLLPITSTIIVLNAMAIWNDFLLPLLLVGQSDKTSTLVLAAYKFQGMFNSEQGKLMAGLFMSVMPMILLFLFMQRYIINGITTGAVKG